MSYTTFPSKTNAGAPAATDDSSKGFVVGSQWVDTTAIPDDVYICSNATVGAATWVKAGGVTAHSQLSTLDWASSKHTGTANSVACFNGTGVTLNAQATVDGTVLTFSGGVLQFLAMAATVAFLDSKTLEVQYGPTKSDVIPAATAAVVTGAYV